MSGSPVPSSALPSVGRSRLRPPVVRALARPRIAAMLEHSWDHRITLIVAPAGSGKTTAIAEFTTGATRPVAWINSAGIDSAFALLAHLGAALHELAPELPAGDRIGSDALDDMLDAIGDTGEVVGLVIDDVHTMFATPAEHILDQLVQHAPENLRIVLAGRRDPGIDLSRLRLMGHVLQIGTEELRFRSWEAEQLFRDLYDTWLRPDDIARLSRRVEGWAAGLQMFHLAARGLSPPEQRRLIDRLNGRARIVREYLAANVLEPITAELRTFLLDTCVVSVITAGLADALRNDSGSQRHLDELARSQLFTVAIDDESYRYHEVLRSQLEVLLLERDGAAGVADRFRHAAELLEASGSAHDALRCFARAGDWEAVRRLASPSDDHHRAATPAWIRDLPPSIVADDPWLLLARSRADWLAGRWSDATESFRAAIAKGIGPDFADRCRRELAAMTAWIDPMAPAPEGWIGLARAGCRRDPIGAAAELQRHQNTHSTLAAAALLLVAGEIRNARDTAERAMAGAESDPIGVAVGLAVVALSRVIEGTDRLSKSLDEAEAYAERSGFDWLARIIQSAFALTDRPAGVDDARRVHERCIADGDPWGAAISGLIGGLGAARRGLPAVADLRDAGARFHALEATTFENLCLVAVATVEGAGQAEAATLARQTGLATTIPIVVSFVRADRSDETPESTEPTTTATTTIPSMTLRTAADLATTVANSSFGPIERHDDASPVSAAEVDTEVDTEPLRVHCLGSFRMAVFGREISLDSLRPRARALLRMLAIHPGNGLHRESIVDALWPDGTAESGIHNLQVAVSAVRKLLANAGVPEAFGIRRQGEAYRLVLASNEASDLAMFLDMAARAKAAAARDDREDAIAAARHALDNYGGELLVEDGPVEYVVRERARVASLRESVAAILADCSIRQGELGTAIDICESTIVEHPYSDELWRLLMLAHRTRGDLAAAGLARSRYEQVLAELRS